MDRLKNSIRDIPNFPKENIVFKDIAPMLANPTLFTETIDAFELEWSGKIDVIAALDARGFIFGSALALRMHLPLVMIRKSGKLPGNCVKEQYDLEYGTSAIEIQENAFKRGSRVLVVDDLLATGGTAGAACALIKRRGGRVAGCAFVIELVSLGGRAKLSSSAQSLLSF